MAQTLRTFVAIDFAADPVRDVLSDLQDLGRPIRTVREPLHLTLKFLGETRPADLAAIGRILAEVTSRHAVHEVDLTGVGAFPRPERPSVIWAGIAPQDPVRALAAELAAELEPLGFPPERRAFHPHITLARVKGRPPAGLADLFDLYGGEVFGKSLVREALHYQSELTPGGSQYSVLARAPLAPAQAE